MKNVFKKKQWTIIFFVQSGVAISRDLCYCFVSFLFSLSLKLMWIWITCDNCVEHDKDSTTSNQAYPYYIASKLKLYHFQKEIRHCIFSHIFELIKILLFENIFSNVPPFVCNMRYDQIVWQTSYLVWIEFLQIEVNHRYTVNNSFCSSKSNIIYQKV